MVIFYQGWSQELLVGGEGGGGGGAVEKCPLTHSELFDFAFLAKMGQGLCAPNSTPPPSPQKLALLPDKGKQIQHIEPISDLKNDELDL